MTELSRFIAPTTLSEFLLSNDRIRGIRGPVGSGKSSVCCWEIMRRATEQRPSKGNVRRSRWAIVRNTYRELVDTTIKTWFDWFPKELGQWSGLNMNWVYRASLDDGTTLEMEIMFRACDKPSDVKKFKSMEITGAWLNEASELPKPVLDMIDTRIGRYPSNREEGASWIGIIMDTNPPDTDHWWYKQFEELRPDGWRQFVQPSGLSEHAENLFNLPPDYYPKMCAGKTKEWIRVFVEGNYGFISDGKPVFSEFHDSIHTTDADLDIPRDSVLVCGIDFGLTPAAVLGFATATGKLWVIDEIVCEDMGAQNFAKLLKHHIHTHYRDNQIRFVGDPAGMQRAQTDETTPFMILNAEGINAIPARTNDFTIRRETVASVMMRLDMTGNYAFVVGKKCQMLRKALGGGYKYKRMQVSGSDQFRDVPDKDKYSHVADALQYMAMEALGTDHVLGRFSDDELDYSALDRGII